MRGFTAHFEPNLRARFRSAHPLLAGGRVDEVGFAQKEKAGRVCTKFQELLPCDSRVGEI